MQNFEVWFLLLLLHQGGSHYYRFVHIASKTIQWLNFKEKCENRNYSTVNACGLAIFSNFWLHCFFSNLHFLERGTHQRQFGLKVSVWKLTIDSRFSSYVWRRWVVRGGAITDGDWMCTGWPKDGDFCLFCFFILHLSPLQYLKQDYWKWRNS